MKKPNTAIAIILLFLGIATAQAGPYAPAAGETGSTAVHMDDASFRGWATGWKDLIYGVDVAEQWRTPEKAMGKAVGGYADILCLGGGGQVTITFLPYVITNGNGYDFAIFENSFSPGFLELAYVEVSSDGLHFVRFPNDSLTATPIAAYGGNVDPTNLKGLASKYMTGYGTPFDLSELSNAPEVVSGAVDINAISYVRLIDVVGDGSCLDTSGDIIYDPYTAYDPEHPLNSRGFDLDAVGFFHRALVMDLNQDSTLDMEDAILALQALVDLPVSLTDFQDLNGDGNLGLDEILRMLNYLAE